jgi:uncharacterized protein (DUF58 family)
MAKRPRITVTPTVEGIGLGFIACCLLASSFIQRVNLLVLVFGLLTALLVVGLFQARRNLRSLSVRRIPPPTAFAGSPFEVGIEVSNPSHRASYAVAVEDTDDSPAATDQEVLFPIIDKGSSSKSKYVITPDRRGRLSLGPMTMSTRFPFGLFTARIASDSTDEIVVYPMLGEMTDRWRNSAGRASDSNRNLRSSPERMQEEFHGLRDYREGDNLRHIHWLTTARRGQPVVKEFETLSSRDVLLFVDPFAADETAETDAVVESAISVAATACVDLCRRLGLWNGRIVFVLAGPEPVVIQGQASGRTMDAALRALALAEPSVEGDWKAAMDRLGPNMCRSAQAWFIGTRPMEHVRREYGSRFGQWTTIDAATIDVSSGGEQPFFLPIRKTAASTTVQV